MSVVFYISGHGFGHASRDIEVINRFSRFSPLSQDGLPRVIIRSAVDRALVERTVRVPYALLAGPCDTGVVQTTSVESDDQATVEAATAFYRTFDARATEEARALADRDVRLVVGDIAPMAFEVAARLGVPSVAMANFTWDWIYETHPGFLPNDAWVLDTIRAAYRKATLALQLPLSDGFEVFPRVRPIPLVARRPTKDRAATRAGLNLPRDAKVALLSFGGYGMPSLDLDDLDCRREWIVVTTDRTSPGQTAPPAHVRILPASVFAVGELRYEDLVAAVDVVVTKPGYGIIAECISANTAMLYTSRGHFREYDLLVAALPRYVRSRFLSPVDLFAGRWRDALEAVRVQPSPPETMAVDGADVAAGILEEFLR